MFEFDLIVFVCILCILCICSLLNTEIRPHVRQVWRHPNRWSDIARWMPGLHGLTGWKMETKLLETVFLQILQTIWVSSWYIYIYHIYRCIFTLYTRIFKNLIYSLPLSDCYDTYIYIFYVFYIFIQSLPSPFHCGHANKVHVRSIILYCNPEPVYPCLLHLLAMPKSWTNIALKSVTCVECSWSWWVLLILFIGRHAPICAGQDHVPPCCGGVRNCWNPQSSKMFEVFGRLKGTRDVEKHLARRMGIRSSDCVEGTPGIILTWKIFRRQAAHGC